eukprot:159505-Prymnesium_polylepis.1
MVQVCASSPRRARPPTARARVHMAPTRIAARATHRTRRSHWRSALHGHERTPAARLALTAAATPLFVARSFSPAFSIWAARASPCSACGEWSCATFRRAPAGHPPHPRLP